MEEQITIQHVATHRVIYALCDIQTKDDKVQMRATHYVCVLSGGRTPIWGIFSARTGNLVRLAGSREMIEKQFPKKAWRRKQAEWKLNAISAELATELRHSLISQQVHREKEE